MISSAGRSYAAQSGAAAVATGLLIVSVAVMRGDGASGLWSLFGWSISAATGVVGGAWVASRHGTAGAGFLVALQACILARLLLSAGGAAASALAGVHAVRAYLAGLLGAFLPLQAFEIFWFVRRAGKP